MVTSAKPSSEKSEPFKATEEFSGINALGRDEWYVKVRTAATAAAAVVVTLHRDEYPGINIFPDFPGLFHGKPTRSDWGGPREVGTKRDIH